jgi:hypothetical protein
MSYELIIHEIYPEEATDGELKISECQWTGNLLEKGFIHCVDNTIGIELWSLLDFSPQDSRRISSERISGNNQFLDFGGLKIFSSQCGF